jgi:hypothetical protein
MKARHGQKGEEGDRGPLLQNEEQVSDRSSLNCWLVLIGLDRDDVDDNLRDFFEADGTDVVLFQLNTLPIDQYEWSTSLACSSVMREYMLRSIWRRVLLSRRNVETRRARRGYLWAPKALFANSADGHGEGRAGGDKGSRSCHYCRHMVPAPLENNRELANGALMFYL